MRWHPCGDCWLYDGKPCRASWCSCEYADVAGEHRAARPRRWPLVLGVALLLGASVLARQAMVADAAATARQNTGLQRAIEREKALGVELEQELRGLDVPALKQPTTVPAAPSAAPSEDAGQEAATDSRQAAPQSPTADIRWQTARCSWYGPGLYGNTTADGTTYTPRTWCVAHKSLPFGTMVELRYRGTTVVAPVRDRGPYVAGRTFDLSNAVAQALGFTGVQTVEWRVVAE